MNDRAPKPHRYTLALATAAFLVSGASLWYSHKAYRLNVETSRSVMDVKIDLLNDWTFDAKTPKRLSTRFTLSNNGKSVIAGILMRVYSLFCYESKNIDPKSGVAVQPCIGEKKYTEVWAEDLGPGASREYRLDVDSTEFVAAVLSRKDFSGKLSGLTMRPKVHYVDAVHGTVRTYCLTMRANDKGMLSKGSLYPCSSSQLFNIEDLLEELKDDRSPHE